MELGALVDAILTQEKRINFNDPQYFKAAEIADKINDTYGDMLALCKKQVAYTGILTDGYYEMPIKGLLDYQLGKVSVLDLKITNTKHINYSKIIDYMGYKNPMWLYKNLSCVKNASLIVYSIPDNSARLYPIDTNIPPDFFKIALWQKGNKIHVKDDNWG